jgi:hypothetical protein
MRNFVVGKVPAFGFIHSRPSLVLWGTSKLRLGGAYRIPQRFRASSAYYDALYIENPGSTGDVGASDEPILRALWELRQGSTAFESGEIHLGMAYVPNSWVGLPCGLKLAWTDGTFNGTGTAVVPLYPWRRLGSDHEEIDFSTEVFAQDGLFPEFGVSEASPIDVEMETHAGRRVVVPVGIRFDAWANVDAAPVETRTKVLRWIEDGQRVAVMPHYNRRTLALYPFQDSEVPIVGRRLLSGIPDLAGFDKPGTLGCYERRNGAWAPSPPGSVAKYANMEPLGRGLILENGSADGEFANFCYPSSPADGSTLGWTVPVGDSGEFDAEVPLPFENTVDRGALRWIPGNGSAGISRSATVGTLAAHNFTFSVFLRGKSGTNTVTITCAPTTAGVPRNSETLTLTSEWTRYFICGKTNGTGDTAITITAQENDVVFVCGAFLEDTRNCGYRSPSAYEPRLDSGSYVARVGSHLESNVQLLGDQGRVSLFWKPGYLGGGSSSIYPYALIGESTDFSLRLGDDVGDGTSIDFISYLQGSKVSARITSWDENTVFFVVVSWKVGTSGNWTQMIEVFSDEDPGGVVGTTTTKATEAKAFDSFSIQSTSAGSYQMLGSIALLRVDSESHIGTAEEETWAVDLYDWFTSAETKELAKILLGREYEIRTGAQIPSFGDPSLIDLPLSFLEKRVEPAAVYKGNRYDGATGF